MVKLKKCVAQLQRGDLIKVSFDPTIGHEQSVYRPALVLSGNTFHKATGFSFCLPITSKKKSLLFEIEVKGKEVVGVALPHGARMLDLQNRNFLFIEKIDVDTTMKAQIILNKIITD